MYIHTVSSNWKSPTLLTTRNYILVFVLQSLWLFHSAHGENGLKTQWNRRDCWRGECSENVSLGPFLCFAFSPSRLNLSSTMKSVIVLSSACTRTLMTPFPCPKGPALLKWPQPLFNCTPTAVYFWNLTLTILSDLSWWQQELCKISKARFLTCFFLHLQEPKGRI